MSRLIFLTYILQHVTNTSPILLINSNAKVTGQKLGGHALVQLALQEDDWKALMRVSQQRTYKKGEYLLREGAPTRTLFQVVRGQLRVELRVQGKSQSIVVGYRSAGEMLGETSLLTMGQATASVAAETETTVLAIEGRGLDKLFETHPELPSRFFCFLASYQAERLYKGTKAFAEQACGGAGPTMAVPLSARLPINEVMSNEAYAGIFAKYLAAEQRGAELEQTFGLCHAIAEYAMLPSGAALAADAARLERLYIDGKRVNAMDAKPEVLSCLTEPIKTQIKSAIRELEAEVKAANGQPLAPKDASRARQIWVPALKAGLAKLEADAFEGFLGSKHYNYILELKAKVSPPFLPPFLPPISSPLFDPSFYPPFYPPPFLTPFPPSPL